MHQRLRNEFLFRLARRALGIIAPCLREEEQRDAFEEFHAAFKEELLSYEDERERMSARLRGISANGDNARHSRGEDIEGESSRGTQRPAGS